MSLEERRGQFFHAHVVGGVFAFAQLFHYDFAFLVEVGGVELRIEIHIRENLCALIRANVLRHGVKTSARL